MRLFFVFAVSQHPGRAGKQDTSSGPGSGQAVRDLAAWTALDAQPHRLPVRFPASVLVVTSDQKASRSYLLLVVSCVVEQLNVGKVTARAENDGAVDKFNVAHEGKNEKLTFLV